MNSFNVGDKVKATAPSIVSQTFKDEVGVVVAILDSCEDTGQQRMEISYNGLSQTAYALKDGIVLVEKAQEDDEWGPWEVAYPLSGLPPSAMIIETDDRGWYRRHKVKKPVPKKQIEVGGKYACGNGFYWVCICIIGDKAWMNQDDGETAYVWTLDGKSISLNETYNIDFTRIPSQGVGMDF